MTARAARARGGARAPRRRWVVAAALAAACACVTGRGPSGRPSHDEGMLLYTVGRLSFEAPAGWSASGDQRRVVVASPRNDGRIDAQRLDRTFRDDRECLSAAEESLARGSARLTNVRRHPTTFAGRKAIVQEADQGGWHGWAWALCDGGEQYRVFFTGQAPVNTEAVRAVRLLGSTASLATRSGA